MADLQKKNQEMIANIENIMTTTETAMKRTNNINSATPLKSDKQAVAALAESKAPALPVKQEKMPSSIRNTSSSNPVTPLEEQISEGN
jgi:hypothetical protein